MQDLVNRVFAAVQAKDLETLMTLFADDALLIDPHFPQERLQGKTAIREAMRHAMAGMKLCLAKVCHERRRKEVVVMTE